jgi:acyl-homoserine-lactone acylase
MGRVGRWVALVAAVVMSVAAMGTAGAAPPGPGPAGGSPYRATVVTTAYGMPHVTASDMGSLGYGNGWAAARDNACIIAESAVTTDGERVRWFGPSQDSVVSDVLNRWLLAEGRVEDLLARTPADRPPGPSEEARAQVEGFAAGFNRWLTDVGGADGITDPACAGADWVRPLTAIDLWRRAYLSSLRASTGALAAGIVAATPPAAPAASSLGAAASTETTTDATEATGASAPGPRRTLPDQAAAMVDRAALDAAANAVLDRSGQGSNAYGLGSKSTTSGNGMVLGNPHFPWDGPDRFWQVHLTIPGELDVQGAALIGTPGVQVGFNADVAWSHTVSTGTRFAGRLLELVPGDPTSYVVDGEVLQMEPTTVTVTPGISGTVWNTIFGPVVIIPSLGLSWTSANAVALQDANVDNVRTLDQWNAMNRATSAGDLVEAMADWLGVPWVNTTGADRHGTAVYAQMAVTTGVPDALATQCIPPPLQPLWQATGIPVLAGTTRACDPVADAGAITDGILPPDQLPVLLTDTYVTQSNDSHWLSNPDQPLEGFARVVGDERTTRSLRTRMGLVQVEERLAGADGLGPPGFTVETLQQVMFGNRNLGGELVATELESLCRDAGTATASDGRTVDLEPSCDALAGWDRRVDLTSTGAALFREFGGAGGIRFAEPFDVTAPIATPRSLDTTDPRVLTALANATVRLQDAGIPLDVALGDVQTEPRNGVAIPMHGGRGGVGVFNVLNAGFQGAAGYPDVTSGASILLTVELTRKGPEGAMLLAYSQSSDPTSPHHGDQTRLYSDEEWVPILFDRGDIERAAVSRVRLVGER